MSATIDVSPFEQALKEFRSSLAPREQSLFTQCRSPEELIAYVQSLEKLKDIQKRAALILHLDRFSKNLSHYFDVIGILVQSHPEYAALAWGAFRLVLQLASNFHEFFEKLARTLLQLSEHLPWHKELASSLMGTTKRNSSLRYQASSRLINSLTKVYVDLFVFLQSVVRVFTKKDTTNRASFVILNSLFWKPFDARFHDILSSMQHHQELLKTELSLYGHQTTHAEITNKYKELKKELLAIRNDTSRHQDRFEELHCALAELTNKLEKSTQATRLMEERLRYIDTKATKQFESFANEVDAKLQLRFRASLEDRMRIWLSAPQYAQDLEMVRECRERGTAEWFLHQQLFQQWLQRRASGQAQVMTTKFGDSTIWVQGSPGFGKTIIAGAVIDELKARAPESCYTLYFFFRQEPSLDNSTAAYRSLLTQILHYCPGDEIFDRFAFGMRNYSTSDYSTSSFSGSQPTGTRGELFELLLLCTEIMGPHYIVLDGIDECCDNASLIRDLTRLSPTTNLILFSRPNVGPLQEKTTRSQRIEIGKSNTDDISVFLQRKLEDLFVRNMLPEDASTAKYADHLTKGADGMFLWARLMTDYLQSDALSDQDRHDTIVAIGMPERLSVMYMRIIKSITQGYSINRKMAKWIFMWLTYAKRPLTVVELEESVNLLNQEKPNKSGRRDFDRTVIMTCASLVEKATFYDDKSKRQISCFRFIHNTVKEYFLDLFTENETSTLLDETRGNVASIVTPFPHSEILQACLRYMLYFMPAQSLSEALGKNRESPITASELEASLPFSSYATVLWTSHLKDTTDEVRAHHEKQRAIADSIKTLFVTLGKFLGDNQIIRAWVEATYILDVDHDYNMKILKAWSTDTSALVLRFGNTNSDITSVLRKAEALTSYIAELDRYWGSSLSACPSRIWTWDEIDVFTPSQFSDRSSATVLSLFAGNPSQAGATLSSQYLCKISRSTSGLLGTLSIWTSKAFESYQEDDLPFPTFLKNECIEGWVARYEIWSLGPSPRRLLIQDIFLESAEVGLQLLHSLRLDTIDCLPWERKWKVQFPVSISPNLQRLIILRTVYWLEPGKNKGDGVIQSSVLDLSLDQSSTIYWTALDANVFNVNHTTRLNQPALYTYRIEFSNRDNDFLFVDRKNIAIFTFGRHGGPTLTSVCGQQDLGFDNAEGKRLPLPSFPGQNIDREFDSWMAPSASMPSREDRRSFWQLHVQFHPSRPLVAYRKEREVYLWAFKNSRSRPILCYKTASGPSSFPEHITFTSNGEQLVIKERNSDLPDVLPLPTEICIALEEESVVIADRDESDGGESNGQLAKRPTLNLWSFGASNRNTMSTTHVQLLASGETLGFTPITSHNGASVLLWRNTMEGFEQVKNDIIKFPEWEGIKNVVTSIKLPEPGQRDVTVVLNKAVQGEQAFGDVQPERFPALIMREVASLRSMPVESSATQQKRLRDGLEKQRQKRQRLTELADGEIGTS